MNTCKYRLVKVHHIKDNIITYWIQYPVKLFGFTMWWNTTTNIPYSDEKAAHYDMAALCSEEFWEMKELWKKENGI